MWTEMSDTAILKEIGKRMKEDLAKRTGVSLSTISKLEKGFPVSNTLMFSAIRGLGMLENIETLIPEPGISPILLKKLNGRMVSRVRLSEEKGR